MNEYNNDCSSFGNIKTVSYSDLLSLRSLQLNKLEETASGMNRET